MVREEGVPGVRGDMKKCTKLQTNKKMKLSLHNPPGSKLYSAATRQ